jgi:TRAP-type C4-dicarboxylate transport system permease small subunit
MNRVLDLYCRLLEALIALFLAAMVVLVFGNVVLRYAFNSGILVSEELSRWLFVWLTFMGAIVGVRRVSHLGTEFLIDRVPRSARRVCLIVAHLLMLWVSALLLQGSWKQTLINAEVTAPATGAPMALVYISCVLFAASTLVFLLLNLVSLLLGRMPGDDLVRVEEYPDAALEQDFAHRIASNHD